MSRTRRAIGRAGDARPWSPRPSVEACWRTAPGTGRQREAVLLQKILDWRRFTELLARGEQGAQRGGWMEAGLRYRDRWESKLLRTASWSPLR